ncbi:hypothetical protein K492DRAFT_200618 [Lichtheimia hyalospora FSU 10163]|nr:hypothetical protein K492DRAFT_200618 [Lichtheimia hyalospora FSU 10163]
MNQQQQSAFDTVLLTRWFVCKYLSQPTNASTSDGGIKTPPPPPPPPPQIPWGGYKGILVLSSTSMMNVGKMYVVGFVKSSNEQSTVEGFLKTISQHLHDCNEPYSLAWIKQSLFNACTVYKAGLSHRSISETDMILDLWSLITYCYGDTNIVVNTGDEESKATSVGLNTNRMLNNRKLQGTKLDMKFI